MKLIFLVILSLSLASVSYAKAFSEVLCDINVRTGSDKTNVELEGVRIKLDGKNTLTGNPYGLTTLDHLPSHKVIVSKTKNDGRIHVEFINNKMDQGTKIDRLIASGKGAVSLYMSSKVGFLAKSSEDRIDGLIETVNITCEEQ